MIRNRCLQSGAGCVLWIVGLWWAMPAWGQIVQSPHFSALTVIEHPTPEELEQGFERWAKVCPHRFAFETRGQSIGGRPILMGRITDRTVEDLDKQVALLTSCHGPKEIAAMTGLLRCMKWLLSDDPEAAEIRRRQIVLVVPYVDPDHVALGELKQTRLVYSGRTEGTSLWTVDGVTAPGKHPEAATLQGIMDEYQPELYIDYHSHNHAERTMWDSTGISWGAPVSRSFLHDIPRVLTRRPKRKGSSSHGANRTTERFSPPAQWTVTPTTFSIFGTRQPTARPIRTPVTTRWRSSWNAVPKNG